MGWVSLHRKIRENWIWQDPVKLKQWLDIVMEVNHAPAKVNIGYELIDCGRGQSIRSLQGWAQRWNISKDSARHFLKLLQKDNMIKLENLKITTRITVCNYEQYNESTHAKQTASKRQANGKQTADYPNNNDIITINNDNKLEARTIDFKNKVLEFRNTYSDEMLKSFYNYWSEPNTSKTKMRLELEKTWELSRRLTTWKNREKKTFDENYTRPKLPIIK